MLMSKLISKSLLKTKSLKWLGKNTMFFQTEKYLTMGMTQCYVVHARMKFEQLDSIVKYK